MSDVTILMPCLNEEASIAFCIEQAKAYIDSRKLTGEILVVDNGSTDPPFSSYCCKAWGPSCQGTL